MRGYVIIDGKRVKVLWRAHKTCVAMKLRKTGRDGIFLEDESEYLYRSPSVKKQLMAGIGVKL